MRTPRKPLEPVGSSLDDLTGFPDWAKLKFGRQLNVAQWGERPPLAKPLRGFGGADVLQLSESGEGGTFRVVFTVRFDGDIYLLHAFHKKSKRGGETPAADLDQVQRRLKMAGQLHEEHRKNDDEAETGAG